ncbi:unnamed protein product, partial [Mesorhabditis spiculigera]
MQAETAEEDGQSGSRYPRRERKQAKKLVIEEVVRRKRPVRPPSPVIQFLPIERPDWLRGILANKNKIRGDRGVRFIETARYRLIPRRSDAVPGMVAVSDGDDTMLMPLVLPDQIDPVYAEKDPDGVEAGDGCFLLEFSALLQKGPEPALENPAEEEEQGELIETDEPLPGSPAPIEPPLPERVARRRRTGVFEVPVITSPEADVSTESEPMPTPEPTVEADCTTEPPTQGEMTTEASSPRPQSISPELNDAQPPEARAIFFGRRQLLDMPVPPSPPVCVSRHDPNVLGSGRRPSPVDAQDEQKLREFEPAPIVRTRGRRSMYLPIPCEILGAGSSTENTTAAETIRPSSPKAVEPLHGSEPQPEAPAPIVTKSRTRRSMYLPTPIDLEGGNVLKRASPDQEQENQPIPTVFKSRSRRSMYLPPVAIEEPEIPAISRLEVAENAENTTEQSVVPEQTEAPTDQQEYKAEMLARKNRPRRSMYVAPEAPIDFQQLPEKRRRRRSSYFHPVPNS